MSGTRLMSIATHARLVLPHQRDDLIGDILCIDEEEPPLRPHDQQPLEGLVVGVLGRQRPQHVGPALAADDGHARMGGLAREPDHRHDDRDDDALERAERPGRRAHAISAQRNSIVRTPRMARNSAGWISPTE